MADHRLRRSLDIRYQIRLILKYMPHSRRADKREQVDPDCSVLILQRNLRDTPIIYRRKVDPPAVQQSSAESQPFRRIMVPADNKNRNRSPGKPCDKFVEHLDRLRGRDLLVINITGQDDPVRLFFFRQIKNSFKNIFLVFDHRKLIDSLSDMKVR